MAAERDHPVGHPAAADTTTEQSRAYKPPFNPATRDWPEGHPASSEHPRSRVVWTIGVDPDKPHLAPFKGKPGDEVEGPQPE